MSQVPWQRGGGGGRNFLKWISNVAGKHGALNWPRSDVEPSIIEQLGAQNQASAVAFEKMSKQRTPKTRLNS